MGLGYSLGPLPGLHIGAIIQQVHGLLRISHSVDCLEGLFQNLSRFIVGNDEDGHRRIVLYGPVVSRPLRIAEGPQQVRVVPDGLEDEEEFAEKEQRDEQESHRTEGEHEEGEESKG